MVAYQPPDPVILMIGASFRGADVIACAQRMVPLVRRDAPALARYGIANDQPDRLTRDAAEVGRYLQDPQSRKHDTALQMADMTELLARIRLWLVEVRELAMINLALDQPSLDAIVSCLPEIADGYPRDVLRELDRRLLSAKDAQPRLDDCGFDDKLLAKGRKLSQQLRTAIGAEDLSAANLPFKVRRLYMRKGSLYLQVKRVHRAARCAFRSQPRVWVEYHLRELEPEVGST